MPLSAPAAQKLNITQIYSAKDPRVALAAGFAIKSLGIAHAEAATREPQAAGVGGFTKSVTALSSLVSIGTGPDGKMWFTEANSPKTGLSSSIAKMTTSGVITEYPLPVFNYKNLTYYIHPLYVTKRSDGYVWFTAGDFFGDVDTSGNLQNLYSKDTADGSQVANYNWGGLTVDANGNLWFLGTSLYTVGSPYTNILFEFIPGSGAFNAYPFSVQTNLYPPGSQIYYMSDGGIWFTNPGTNQIVRSDLNGNLQALTPQGPNTIPTGLGMGSDGNLYWSETSSASNTSYLSCYNFKTGLATTVLQSSTKIGNTAGAAGFVWYFTPQYMNQFNTTTHAVHSYPLSASLEGYLTQGPDTNLYFISGNSSVSQFVTH